MIFCYYVDFFFKNIIVLIKNLSTYNFYSYIIIISYIIFHNHNILEFIIIQNIQ